MLGNWPQPPSVLPYALPDRSLGEGESVCGNKLHRLVASVCVYAESLSRVRFCVTPWTVARQAPLTMELSRQECWCGLTLPPPGALPDPGTEHTSLASLALAGGLFTSCTTWEAPTGGLSQHKWRDE